MKQIEPQSARRRDLIVAIDAVIQEVKAGCPVQLTLPLDAQMTSTVNIRMQQLYGLAGRVTVSFGGNAPMVFVLQPKETT